MKILCRTSTVKASSELTAKDRRDLEHALSEAMYNVFEEASETIHDESDLEDALVGATIDYMNEYSNIQYSDELMMLVNDVSQEFKDAIHEFVTEHYDDVSWGY